MQDDWIDEIGVASGAATEMAACRQGLATFWQSSGSNRGAVRYDATLPPGLHIGCGWVPGLVCEGELGRITLCESGVMLMLCREPVRMETRLKPGPFHAAGLSIDYGELEHYPNLVGMALAADRLCRSLQTVPAALVLPLVLPIDPWFQGSARRLAWEARALGLIALLEQVTGNGPQDREDGQRHRRIGETARAIIEADYALPLTIKDLARRIGCSPRTLTASFRQCHGTSLAAYLTRHRLELAAGYLSQGMGCKEAAYRVGYRPAHFATAFKRHYGISPSAWRTC